MFTIPATSKTIITIVVSFIAVDATIGLLTLSWMLINKITPDNVLVTAYVGLTSGLVGALTGLLANTRSSPGTNDEMAKAVVSTAVTAVTADKPTT